MEERIPKEIVARPFIGHGDAGYEIVRIARDERADLIVIATHGLTGWRHLIFGSVAERVVRSAACPVLTVRAPRQ
jgi:universal stress protein A